MPKAKSEKVEVKATCIICQKKIDLVGVIVAEAMLSRRTYDVTRVIGIYCEPCWNTKARRPRSKKGFVSGYCKACATEWQTPDPLEACPHCGSRDIKQGKGKQ